MPGVDSPSAFQSRENDPYRCVVVSGGDRFGDQPVERLIVLRQLHRQFQQGPLEKSAVPRPFHGWAIAQRIRQMSSDVLQVGQSALYPALHKLERQGWITSEWDTSETNRRAKYYSLTRSGRKALAEEAANWERLSTAISGIVRTV